MVHTQVLRPLEVHTHKTRLANRSCVTHEPLYKFEETVALTLIDICDRACENQPSECKQLLIFLVFPYHNLR